MKPFLNQFHLSLTPLTPIHIGCGQDFEPTNYLIEDEILYGFEPSQARLPENLRQELHDIGMKSDLRRIQHFFKTNSRYFKIHAHTLIPVTKGIATEFANSLGRAVQQEGNGNTVINSLTIERCSHNPHTGVPLIPGSSIKGALRTAILDHLNQDRLPLPNERSSDLEKRLLGGDFHLSPLRLLKVADMMPVGELAHEIRYAVNRKKRKILDKNGNEIQAKGLSTRKEVIAPGQYRALQASVTLHHPEGIRSMDIPTRRFEDLRQIAHWCNRFYLPKLRTDLQIVDDRQFASPEWLRSFRALLASDLGARLDSGDAFLINLGRYGGAESKTLDGNGVAQIKIMQGNGMRALTSSYTKTIGLAAGSAADRSNMQPYGWALVEVNPEQDLPTLKAWCKRQDAQRPDMREKRKSFADERHKVEQEYQRELKEQAMLQEKAAADEKAVKARAIELAAMTENTRKISVLRDRLSAHHAKGWKKQKTGEAFYNEINALLKEATSNDWPPGERTALRDCISEWAPKTIDIELKKSKLKNLLNIL